VTRSRLSERLRRRWHPLPLRTIRLRLTLVYGGLFLVCGAALLGITYGLVSSQYTPSFFIKSGSSQVATQVGIADGVVSRSLTSGAVHVGPSLGVKLAIGSPNRAAALALSRCMRANGEPSFPDPIATGGIYVLRVGGIQPDSPRFIAAAQKCQKGRPALEVTRPVSVASRSRSGNLAGAGGNLSVVPTGALQAGLDLAAPSKHYLETAAIGQVNAARARLLIELAIALAITALIAIGLGWVVAGRALRPLREITAAAQEISATSLHRRLGLTGPDDELRRLGNTFDRLLERLEKAFSAQRQFAANVSHELRTPLTYERTLLEVALADPNADAQQLRAVCEQLLRSGEQQQRLIDALLDLSRGQRGIEAREPIDLAELVGRVMSATHATGLTVHASLQPASATGEPRLVERLVANLIANAVVHNVKDGWIEVSTDTREGRARLSVKNGGPVVAAADVERLFEPFERAAGARTVGGVGIGLGLSIVKAIAEAHDATIAAAPIPDGGLAITVTWAP
jgi:signal transduction histidine kinase